MSHAAIVELQPYKVNKDDWVDQNYMLNDPGIQYHTEYVGDCFSDNERKEYIKKDLVELFSGIATIDTEKETITFLTEEEITETVMKEIQHAISKIRSGFSLGSDSFYYFRFYGRWFRQDYTIIWSELSSYTSAQFIEDAKYKAGETYYIGAVYDYHI